MALMGAVILSRIQWYSDLNIKKPPERIMPALMSPIVIYTEQKMKRPMHFSKSTLFKDIARYVYYGTDIRLPDAIIRF